MVGRTRRRPLRGAGSRRHGGGAVELHVARLSLFVCDTCVTLIATSVVDISCVTSPRCSLHAPGLRARHSFWAPCKQLSASEYDRHDDRPTARPPARHEGPCDRQLGNEPPVRPSTRDRTTAALARLATGLFCLSLSTSLVCEKECSPGPTSHSASSPQSLPLGLAPSNMAVRCRIPVSMSNIPLSHRKGKRFGYKSSQLMRKGLTDHVAVHC